MSAGSLALLVAPALADQECGSGLTATCTSAGNPYPNGVTYSAAGQTLNIDTGVVINSTNGVTLSGSGDQKITVTGTGVTISSSGSGRTAVNISGATGAATIDTSKASVSVTGAGGGNGVQGVSTGGAVSVTTADVTLGNADVDGFAVVGYATAGSVDINTKAGTVSTSAGGGVGIYAMSFTSSVTVTTAGVTISGNSIPADAIYGIYAVSGGAGAGGAITIDTTAGAVTMSGTSTSHAIYAENASGAGGGPVKVTTANVSTKAANADGVYAQSRGTGATGAVTVDSTAGTVKTEGAGAIGIFANNTAAASGGLVTVHAGDVTTTGTGAAYGIRANSTSGAVTITANDIATKGSGAYGVYATGTGALSVTTGDVTTEGDGAHGIQPVTSAGNVTVDSTAGKIKTTGQAARGVNIDKLAGTVTVHAGAVETSGDNSTGIHVYNGTRSGPTAGGAITITANSVVATGKTVPSGTAPNQYYSIGDEADAIDVFNVGAGANGKINIDTSVGATPNTLGTVSASGYKSRGIVAVSGMLQYVGPNVPNTVVGGGAIDIKTGTVTTTGDFGTAISAETYGSGADGKITINALGKVSASGQNLFNLTPLETQGNYPPNGIYAVSWGGGDVEITTKDVSSAGEAASAISAQSGNGTQNAGIGKVTINTTGGTVTATGAGADGIGVGGSSGVVSITSGIVNTSGDYGYGIQASNTGPNSAMTIDTRAGKITTTGKGADGIGATAGDLIQNKPNAGLLQILAGDIDVQGPAANAIYAGTYNGTIDLQIFGAVKTGALGGDGVYLRPDGTSTATITVKSTGSVKTSAAQADGFYIAGIGGGLYATNTVVVAGIVEATGTQSRGIVVNGSNDQITVNANASVAGVDAGIRLQETNGNAKVTNAGTVTGTGGTAVEFLGTTTATFDNDGSVKGNVLMWNGADTVILRSNSAITGNVDGKGGTDKLELTGAGTASTLDVAKILNFEAGEKTGAGTWALTGTNTALMPTFGVSAGRLAVNANVSGTEFTVANGATLGGVGTLKSVAVTSGGTLAPGNSIGTLTGGTATYEGGAVYEVEVDATTSDKLVVTGTATIDSTAEVHVVVTGSGTYTDGYRWQILTAATRNGAFSPTVVDNSAFIDFTLDQSIAGEVWLVGALTAELPDVADTPNQIAAAGGIDEQGPGTPLFNAIVPLDAEAARHAFDLSSGEIHATAKDIVLDDSRFVRDAILARLNDAFASGGEGGGGADPALARWAAWGQAYGSGGAGVGDGNAAGYTRSIGGFVAGIDTGEAGAWQVGGAIGYRGATISVPDRASTAAVDSYEVAAYGGVEQGAVALRFGGALSSGNVDSVRNDIFGAFSETLAAHYGIRTRQLFAEAAYRARLGGIDVEPFANVARVAVDTDGFTETGGAAALTAGAEHHAMTLASFGARFTAPLPAMHARLTALIAWQHRFGDMTPTANLAFSGGTPFTVAGVPRQRDSLKLEAGLEWDISPHSTFSLAYTGQLASGASDHGARARLTFRF
ncbi:MAG TPA: autotransporter domain-containing protein [Bauldia sp.]|nr:autotransporter domain-containing protein [Bauldia sp.]